MIYVTYSCIGFNINICFDNKCRCIYRYECIEFVLILYIFLNSLFCFVFLFGTSFRCLQEKQCRGVPAVSGDQQRKSPKLHSGRLSSARVICPDNESSVECYSDTQDSGSELFSPQVDIVTQCNSE